MKGNNDYWASKSVQDAKNQKAIILQNLLNRATEIAIYNATVNNEVVTKELLLSMFNQVAEVFNERFIPKKK